MTVFHGWKMAFAAAGLQLIQAMMLYQAFGAYVAVLATEMGWSKTSLSVGAAMLAMEAALLGPDSHTLPQLHTSQKRGAKNRPQTHQR